MKQKKRKPAIFLTILPSEANELVGGSDFDQNRAGHSKRFLGQQRKHSKDAPLSRGTARPEKGPLRSVKEQDNRQQDPALSPTKPDEKEHAEML
jgi:hypothetical protein